MFNIFSHINNKFCFLVSISFGEQRLPFYLLVCYSVFNRYFVYQ